MNKSKQKNLPLVIGSFLLSIIFISFIPNDVNVYFWNYIIDGMLGLFLFFIASTCLVKRQYGLFSPFTIFTVLYLFLFFITPMYDIVLGNTSFFGVDLFDYGIKGSIIAFIGYISFYLVYCASSTHIKTYNFCEQDSRIVPFVLIMYTICLFANLWYLIKTSGNSIMYVFTLGILGAGGQNEKVEVSLGFISMLSFSLPATTLLYIEYGKNSTLKVILFLLMFILQVERGFRFYILQIAIMFVAYYFIRNNKRINVIHISILSLLLLIPIVLMTMFRNSIRVGDGIDFSLIDFESITEAVDDAFWDNFRIYKTYYGIIKAVPNLTGYMFGKQMIIYTIIMFVPRMIWPSKPQPPGMEAVALGVSEYSVLAGTAYPCIGEYYYEFGWLGVILFMAIFAKWMKKNYDTYMCDRNSNVELMVYCTLIGAILQIAIRGYTPSNFWMIVFSVLPYVISDIIFKQFKNTNIKTLRLS